MVKTPISLRKTFSTSGRNNRLSLPIHTCIPTQFFGDAETRRGLQKASHSCWLSVGDIVGQAILRPRSTCLSNSWRPLASPGASFWLESGLMEPEPWQRPSLPADPGPLHAEVGAGEKVGAAQRHPMSGRKPPPLCPTRC